MLFFVGEYNQFFDIDKHVKHVVKEAFEECDTSQVCAVWKYVVAGFIEWGTVISPAYSSRGLLGWD